MNKSVTNKKMPTALGIALLVALLFATTMLVRSGILFPIRATDTDEPKAVQISNVTDTSFTVSYSTNSPVTGAITYGETEEYGTVTLDERDTATNNANAYTIHAVTVSNLKPQTKYFFAVISGSATYKNNGTSYAVTTAGTLPAPTEKQSPLTGAIMKPDGTKPESAIVYVSTENSQTVASLVKPDGSYTLSIETLRNKELTSYEPMTDQTVLRLNFIGDGLLSSVKVTKDKSHPLPLITLSQDYDFTLASGEQTNPVASESAETETSVFPKFAADQTVNTNPQILNPQKDEELSDFQPKFTGTAPPNRTVEITINSNHQIRATVRTDKYGNWTYRPAKPLEPGKHTIQIKTRDEAGLLRTITHTFIVNAQGSQFTEPSVSPTKRPTPTDTSTPSPTKGPTTAPTRLPTAVIIPTAVFTPSPTLIPTATSVPILTPEPTKIVLIPTQAVHPSIDNAGSNEVMITVSIATIAMIGGAVLFFLTQGIGL